MNLFVIILYVFFLLFIFVYSALELMLALGCIKVLRNLESTTDCPLIVEDQKPLVTIQLPVYNELYVIERLIDAVVAFDWPREKLQIQVLDDSTDETVEHIAKKVKELTGQGIEIKHIRRSERKGFKAGALAYGLKEARGDYVAIFDADFVPGKQFLNETIPYFLQDKKIGVVQARWGHLNRNYSILTKLQALALDFHFKIEQLGRNRGGHFINFNGTAGVWRKECIYDAGNWQADTLTEDLDLSYRAQLKGWKFKYVVGVESPAELPVTMSAMKSQQFRWAKGAAECTRKNLVKVLKQRDLGVGTKIFAVFHLLNSFMFICVNALVLLSVPMMFVIRDYPQNMFLHYVLSFFFVSTIMLAIIYFIAYKKAEDQFFKTLWKFLIFFPVFLTINMGIGLYNCVGVLEGYVGKKSAFIRTPKYNVNSKKDNWRTNKYHKSGINMMLLFECLASLYAVAGIVIAFRIHNYPMVGFLMMVALGFGVVCIYTVKHAFRLQRI